MPKDKSLKPDIDEDLEIGQRLNWKVICVSSSFSLSKSLTFRIFLSSSFSPSRARKKKTGRDLEDNRWKN